MEDCLFCKIVSGEIPTEKVYEDEQVIAFYDIVPQAPTHILIIPKTHAASIVELRDDACLAALFAAARKIADREGLTGNGFRLIINTGDDGGQTVHHLHLHLLGGRRMGWPPG